ncbi:MAG: hypothetical protein K0S08_1877 [Gammaproteobacteria bacterium]|jgi:hypothetical protein|nr:hypothetical protein [Gammaproteobacteria bacterium]
MIPSKRLLAGLFLSTMAFSSISAYALRVNDVTWQRIDRPITSLEPGSKANLEWARLRTINGALNLTGVNGASLGSVLPMISVPEGEVIDEASLPSQLRALPPAEFLEVVKVLAGSNSGQLQNMLAVTSFEAPANLVPTNEGVKVLFDLPAFGFTPDRNGAWWFNGIGARSLFQFASQNPGVATNAGLVVKTSKGVVPWSQFIQGGQAIRAEEIMGFSFESLSTST